MKTNHSRMRYNIIRSQKNGQTYHLKKSGWAYTRPVDPQDIQEGRGWRHADFIGLGALTRDEAYLLYKHNQKR